MARVLWVDVHFGSRASSRETVAGWTLKRRAARGGRPRHPARPGGPWMIKIGFTMLDHSAILPSICQASRCSPPQPRILGVTLHAAQRLWAAR